MTIIKMEGSIFRKLEAKAKADFERWEEVNKAKKEKQCFNSIKSCRVGVFCEWAVKMHLLNYYKFDLLELNVFGEKERHNKKQFRGKPDIEVITSTKHIKAEIKGISEGQPKSQVLTYHADKYHKNNFTHLIFCELFLNEENEVAEVEIYLIEQLRDTVRNPIYKNLYGKECYTNENFINTLKNKKQIRSIVD